MLSPSGGAESQDDRTVGQKAPPRPPGPNPCCNKTPAPNRARLSSASSHSQRVKGGRVRRGQRCQQGEAGIAE